MDELKLKLSIFGVIFIFLMGATMVNTQNNIGLIQFSSTNNLSLSEDIIVNANETSFFLRAKKTINFIFSTQNTAENNASSMDQIYFRLATIKLLDPGLTNLSPVVKQFWANQIYRFQNINGGFGGWKNDVPSLSNTLQAVEILDWLGEAYNKTQVKGYLDSLRISLTNGYSSNKYDSDSDVYSTYQAVKAYSLLGFQPENVSDVSEVFMNAQNDNLDTNIVPSVEFGGFGAQTNNQKSIFWTSEASITRAALLGMNYLGITLSSVEANNSALTFSKNLQSPISGGFYNVNPSTQTITPSVSGPYTTTSIETILNLNGTLNNQSIAVDYLTSLYKSDGGFGLKSSSTKSTLRGTYYSTLGLKKLGVSLPNTTKTLEYVVNWYQIDGLGGFGASPGETSTLRETFDAVASLNVMGHVLTTNQKNEIASFVDSYRNLDGGYGILQSYSESTLRAVEIYNYLGLSFPNPSQTINFLQGLQRNNGGFEKAIGKGISYVISTYRSIKALNLLNSNPIDTPGVINFISNLQQSDGGFAGGASGDNSDVTTTYRAASTLKILSASETSFNKADMINFIKDSQTADGGFKRSPYDVLLPKNVSNMIHTYSAIRTLILFNERPLNLTGVYDFLTGTRNLDGGFAEHARFTSDIAYTFTGLTVMKELNSIASLRLRVPHYLKEPMNPSKGIKIDLIVEFLPVKILVTDSANGNIIYNATQTNKVLSIETSLFASNTYNFNIIVIDNTKSVIDFNLKIILDDSVPLVNTSEVSQPETSSQPSATTEFSGTMFIVGLLTLGVFSLYFRKRRK